jgi:malonate decarboxylase beta subunit
MQSYYEATARQRLAIILDADTFREILPPAARVTSPHLRVLDSPVAFDDGIVVGSGVISGRHVHIAAQEGGFMGGAVGEVHGAKLCGLLERARRAREATVLLVESGGVRLQEANAGLIAVSEVIRAILAARADGLPVIAVIGGQYGCFGGMGIAATCCSALIMSEEGRLGLSGPEVIETARGVDEFDSRDRARVWRTTGGRHRYLLGDCTAFVEDSLAAFRQAIVESLGERADFDLEALTRAQANLEARVARFGQCHDGIDIWRALGWEDAEEVQMLPADAFVTRARDRRAV